MTLETNPFIIAGRIPEPYFCDRVEESKRLLQCITNQENVVLISPRRVGKSELVNHCFDDDIVAQNLIAITIDILHTTSLREFIMVLGNAIYQRIAKQSERLFKLFVSSLRTLHASFGYDPISNTPTFAIQLGDIIQPEYTLEEIFTFINQADQRCIIMIDEFQQIANYKEDKNIEALLRSHIQRCTNANFIFAGSQRRMMGEMFLDANRPFYQSATLLTLAPIELQVYQDFVIHHFNQAGKKIQRESIEMVYNTFDGVTFYIQRIMHDAYAELQAGNTADQELMQYLINRYIDESATRLREQMAFVTEQQKELLYAICQDGIAERITSSKFIKQHRLKSASAVQSAAKRLLETDIITEQERKYKVSDPLLRLWLNR